MISKSIILNFPREQANKPVLSRLIRKYDLEVNVIHAHIAPDEMGVMFIMVMGEMNNFDKAMEFLKETGIAVILPVENLVLDEDKCVHCGACAGHCQQDAFEIDRATWKIIFDKEKCIGCGLCVSACYYGAIESVNEYLLKRGRI